MTQPFTLLFLVLTIGLIARLTRLAVDDAITGPIRDKIFQASQAGGDFVTTEANRTTGSPRVQAWVERPKKLKHKLATFAFKLVDCAWCFSVWAAAEVVGVAAYVSNGHHAHLLSAYWWVAAAGTASYVTGFLTSYLYSRDDA